MEGYEALKNADEVRTFPTIAMPPPVFKIHTGKGNHPRGKDIQKKAKVSSSDEFPGLLKTAKSSIVSGRKDDQKSNIFTGQDTSNLKLDVSENIPAVYEEVALLNSSRVTPAMLSARAKGVTKVDLSLPVKNHPSASGAQIQSQRAQTATGNIKSDAAIEELRNYLVLMDQYSLHNFLIYEGRTLKETPEYQSFQRAYQYKWGAITSIITQLEEFLTRNDVKLAIINGPQVFELARLNLPVLKKDDIYSCIANVDQVDANLDTTDLSKKQMLKVVVKIQALVRMFLCVQRYHRSLKQRKCATTIQAIARLMIARLRYHHQRHQLAILHSQIWDTQRQKLRDWWTLHSQDKTLDHSRTVLYLPSVSIAQYLRLETSNLQTLQNLCISNLYFLADNSIELTYIAPFNMSHYQMSYHEKFLSLLNISTLPKRLITLFPDQSHRLPQHLSLAQQLWHSSSALKKLSYYSRRAKIAYIIPSSLGWAEKRIANHLQIPLLGPDPTIAETISSRSFLKTFFMESSVNIPLGAHDIHTVEDLIVALTRLIASNLAVMRWLIRLNYDHNNESCVVFEVEKLSILPTLRAEQNEMIGDSENLQAWYSRPVQLSIRRRILAALKREFMTKIRICRKDIYPSWEHYTKYMRTYGAVIEADPIELVGHVTISGFISPIGEVTVMGLAQRYQDEYFQRQFYTFPQTLVSSYALHGMASMLMQRLYKLYDVIGFLSIHATVVWDGLEQQPRLWATDLEFGNSSLHGAMGTASVLLKPQELTSTGGMPLSLAPVLPTDRSFVYIPAANHESMAGTHDDMFFKLCRMRGIAYDHENQVGSLFFLPDTIITGTISLLCIAKTRTKAVEQAAMTLGFVQRNYGIDREANSSRRPDNLSKILINVKKILRNENVQFMKTSTQDQVQQE